MQKREVTKKQLAVIILLSMPVRLQKGEPLCSVGEHDLLRCRFCFRLVQPLPQKPAPEQYPCNSQSKYTAFSHM